MFPKKEMAANGFKAVCLLTLAGLLAKCAPQPAPTETSELAQPTCGPLAMAILDELGEEVWAKNYPLELEQVNSGYERFIWSLGRSYQAEVEAAAAGLTGIRNAGLYRQGITMLEFVHENVWWAEQMDSSACSENPKLDVDLYLRAVGDWQWLNPDNGPVGAQVAFSDGQSQISATLGDLYRPDQLPSDNQFCEWVKGDPLTVAEKANGSFRIVWGSPQAKYVRDVVTRLGDICTYQTAADGNLVGAMEIYLRE